MLNSIVLLILGGVLYVVWQKLEAKQKNYPPGPIRWPIIGNLVEIALADSKHVYKALSKMASTYGGVMYAKTGVSNIVVVSGYEALKEALASETFIPRFSPSEAVHMERSYGKPLGVINSNGDAWVQTRRLTVRHMKDLGLAKRDKLNQFIHEEFDTLVDLFKKREDGQNQVVVEPGEMFKISNVNLIWRSISGRRFDLEDPVAIGLNKSLEEIFRYMDLAGGVANAFPVLLDLFPGLTGRTELYKHIHKANAYTKQIVAEVRATGQYRDSQENFVESYLKAIDEKGGKSDGLGIYTDLNLAATLFDLFWASQDTSAATEAMFFRYMVLYPEVQEKMRREINRVIEPGAKVALEDKLRLKFCRAVTLETHRHGTVIPLTPRVVFNETQFRGYTLPANTTAILNYYSSNHDPALWGDPDVFRPNRFLNSASGDIVNADRVFIFGGGKRDCIGQTIADAAFFIFACNFVRNYAVLPLPGKSYSFLENATGISTSPRPYAVILKKL